MFECSTSYFDVLLNKIFTCNSNCTYTLLNTILCVHILITHVHHVWTYDYLTYDIKENTEPKLNSLKTFFSLSLEFDAEVLQGTILDRLILLVDIDDSSIGLSSNLKLFADDMSLFSTVHNINLSSSYLNDGFKNKLKRSSFSCKSKRSTHLPLKFNGSFINQKHSQKHLGLILE